MGCLDVVIRSLRKAIEVVWKPLIGICVRFSRLGGVLVDIRRLWGMCARFRRVTCGMGVNVGLICAVGVGKYEYLECSDLGFIRTYDKGFIIVPKH